jgi:hypothetical protein
MAYQPNPFVNPNQRGVELPDGRKDLLEALQKKAGPGEAAEDRAISITGIWRTCRDSCRALPLFSLRQYLERYHEQ